MNTTNSQDSSASLPPAPEPSFRPPGARASAGGNLRWLICGLLLFSTTINSLDKFVIGYLKDYFCSADGFGWSNSHFSYITISFTISWSVATLLAGVVIDKIGSRLGLGIAVAIWSTFEILNSFAGRHVVMHMITRSLLGVGEAGAFPGALKTVAEWFPKKERAFATGIFNTGASIGAMTAALFVPWCLIHYGPALGWRLSLVYTGGIGFVWLIFWFLLGGVPAKLRGNRLSEAEYAYIHQDDAGGAPSEKAAETPRGVSWFKLLTYRQTWAYSVGKFMTDGIWWFYLFWLPDYLHKQFHMTTEQVRWPTFIAWSAAIVGSLLGGRIPMFLMNKGWPLYKARTTSMLLFAALPMSAFFVQYFANVERFGDNALVYVIALICFALAAHQMWSANLYTTPSDMFPKKAVASVSGIGIAAGGLGGATIQWLVGLLTDYFEGHGDTHTAYTIMFVVAALAYLTAWVIFKVLVPRWKPVTDL